MIAEATREGRRREFAHFRGFDDELPDPQSEQTFLRSKLDPKPVGEWFREAVVLRRALPVELDAEVDGSRLVLRRGVHTLSLDFDTLGVERS